MSYIYIIKNNDIHLFNFFPYLCFPLYVITYKYTLPYYKPITCTSQLHWQNMEWATKDPSLAYF